MFFFFNDSLILEPVSVNHFLLPLKFFFFSPYLDFFGSWAFLGCYKDV